MNQDPTSLDRLHDLVLPPEISWWPPAPGWYVVMALLVTSAAWWLWKAWRKWRANAYRRAALHELASAGNITAVAELLRRTALARAPRRLVAELNGPAWIDWLAQQCARPLPDAVRTKLSSGPYARPDQNASMQDLRDYAAHWITHHQLLLEDASL